MKSVNVGSKSDSDLYALAASRLFSEAMAQVSHSERDRAAPKVSRQVIARMKDTIKKVLSAGEDELERAAVRSLSSAMVPVGLAVASVGPKPDYSVSFGKGEFRDAEGSVKSAKSNFELFYKRELRDRKFSNPSDVTFITLLTIRLLLSALVRVPSEKRDEAASAMSRQIVKYAQGFVTGLSEGDEATQAEIRANGAKLFVRAVNPNDYKITFAYAEDPR
jgi:hypothetical protein